MPNFVDMDQRIFHFIFGLFLLIYLFVGFRIYPDYGVPVDEYSQTDLGRVNYERIIKGSLEIQTHFDRYYGPAFEVPLYIFSGLVNKQFGIEEVSARHLGNFLFFASSLIFFYLFLTNTLSHPGYGLLGTALLALSPRFFAESFYNTKDIAFMSATILVLYAASRFRKTTWLSLLFLAATTGFAIGIRAQGLLLLAVNAVVLLRDGQSKAFWYVILTLLVTFGLYPLFWNDTLKNIVGFWQTAVHPLGVPTLYLGNIYISPNIPWSYHFVWVAITSLLSVLVAAITGMIQFVARGKKDRLQLVMFLIVTGTFATSVFFHPRSYDGWRHIYYIYHPMIGFAMYELKVARRRVRVALLVFFFIDMICASWFMLKNHPNQYVYFNILAGGYRNAKANFDFDYWGMSQKQILEYLVQMRVPIGTHVFIDYEKPSPYTERVLITALRTKGMTLVDSVDDADVYVAINRDYYKAPSPEFDKIYAVSVGGADLSAVYSKL